MDRVPAFLRGLLDFVDSFFPSRPAGDGTYAETHTVDPSSFHARGPNRVVDNPETIQQYLDHVEGRPDVD